MKILLDECIERKLAREFVGYEIKTVPQMGWAGTKNGALLALAAQEFDVFITVDRNLSFEQTYLRYCSDCFTSLVKPLSTLETFSAKSYREFSNHL